MQISFRHLDCRSFSPFTNLAEIYIMTFTTNQRYAGRLNAFKIGAAEYWPG
ncbi:MAG: hypothetical protein ACI8UP_005556, partial [Porticoccaceae bacterium]